VLFDIGDTLVDHWTSVEEQNALALAALREEFGERDWHAAWVSAKIEPVRSADGDLAAIASGDESVFKQETLAWYEAWFTASSVSLEGIDLERLRARMCVPLDLVCQPVAGAFDALRWCKAHGLAVVLVTNTLSRGDAEALEDWRRFGLADVIDGVVSSHSIGWQKPHRRIFERALEIAGTTADRAVMVGDRMLADIWGAKRLGMRAVLRRTPHEQAPMDVTPDAIIDDLTELPGLLATWLDDVPNAHEPSASQRGERR
jgi:FMN phosphatase YigB (HAD superfamily)